jgi:hypothetical protein
LSSTFDEEDEPLFAAAPAELALAPAREDDAPALVIFELTGSISRSLSGSLALAFSLKLRAAELSCCRFNFAPPDFAAVVVAYTYRSVE